MVDNLSQEKRSRVMGSIRGKDTKPELILWKFLDHRNLRRYPKILSNPDIGNRSRKIAIFVDGCFWHGCPTCYRAPTTRPEYWERKLQRNRSHDEKSGDELVKKGYVVMRFWEHDVVQNPEKVAGKILEAWSARKG